MNKHKTISSASAGVQEIDPHHDDDQRNICAVLLPISTSAVYSSTLKENSYIFQELLTSNSLPSPSNSSSEDDSNDKVPTTFKRRHKINFRPKAGIKVFVLSQSVDNEKFTLGSSIDNDLAHVVLQHPSSSEGDWCWINLVHAHLYPEPNSSRMSLFNNSTTEFSAHSLATKEMKNISPGEEFYLSRGSWQIILGAGLEFQIKIFPRSPERRYLGTPIYPLLPISVKRLNTVPDRRKNTPALRQARLWPVPSTTETQPLTQEQTTGNLSHTLVFQLDKVMVKVCGSKSARMSAQLWRNELDILSALNHPSIVKLLRHDASMLSLELEYVGRDLSKFIDDCRMCQLPPDAAYYVWFDISAGIEYMHDQKVLYLDIKPQNILLSADYRAKICDFGISLRNATKPVDYSGGTPHYIPPEYVYDQKRGRPSDIWAFGVSMMFALGLIELPPSRGWKIANITRKEDDTRKMLDWLEKVSLSKEKIPKKHRLLREMLESNPSDRITSSKLVASLRRVSQIRALSSLVAA